jgi:phage gp36-like protein
MAHSTSLALLASAARVGPGTGAAVDLGAARTASVSVSVTVASGSLTVVLETSLDGLAWRTLRTTSAITTTGLSTLRCIGTDRYLRASWTMTGAGFTFSVSGTSLVSYATPSQLDALGLASVGLETITDEVKDDALVAASTEADGYLNSRYALPLTAWGQDLQQHVINIAGYRLMLRRGFSPVAAEDDSVRQAYTDALAWLKMVKDERISPPEIRDSTVDVYDAGGFVVSRPKRGW